MGLDLAPPVAVVGGRVLSDLVDTTTDLGALDRPAEGCWAVVLPFPEPGAVEPAGLLARFRHVEPRRGRVGEGVWPGVAAEGWRSSLDRGGFEARVDAIRAAIAAGDVYQVNLTRRLSAPVPVDTDILGLGQLLAERHPAPYAATIRLPGSGVHIASASPELFLRRRGAQVWSSPIKGTSATLDGFLPKDRAENVMIVDLVRNDLGRVCEWGTVTVPSLLAAEAHPGLHHLVSTVTGRLRPDAGWPELLAATFPPGSVTGAPKLAAIDAIDLLEPVRRDVYCGAVGWVDATTGDGELNVAIRTFWLADGQLHFGTGGGITWDSTPAGEWQETELKAHRLLAAAAALPAEVAS